MGGPEGIYALTGEAFAAHLLAMQGITPAEACFWRIHVDHCPPSWSRILFQPHGKPTIPPKSGNVWPGGTNVEPLGYIFSLSYVLRTNSRSVDGVRLVVKDVKFLSASDICTLFSLQSPPS